MQIWKKLKFSLRSLWQRGDMRKEIEEELDGVLQTMIDEKLLEGTSPEEARRVALLELGNPAQIVEECHDAWGGRFLENFVKDLRYAARNLLKSPRFSGTAILTLGICFGANLTIFSVLDAIVLRALPFSEPERLVGVYNAYPGAGIDRSNPSVANYFERRNSIEAFQSLSLMEESPLIVGEPGSYRLIDTANVTPEFFETLKVPLAMGREFVEADLVTGSDPVAIITDQFWRTEFKSDPKVLGRRFMLGLGSVTVVGVLPPGFKYLSSRSQVYRPLYHQDRMRR